VRNRVAIFLVAAMACVTSACATSRAVAADEAPVSSARLRALSLAAPAPAGLAVFCAESRDLCGADGLRGVVSFEPTGATSGRTPSGSDLFQAILSARLREGTHEGQTQLEEEGVARMDAAAWQELRRVHRQVNWEIIPQTDQAIYGRAEVWAMPLSRPLAGARPRRGDCEDFVLEKRARLLRQGWSARHLSIATALAPGVGMHAVLIVHTDRGDYVLDNLYEEPKALDELNYVWLSQQRGEDLLSWSSVERVAITSSLSSAGGSPTQNFQNDNLPALPDGGLIDVLLSAPPLRSSDQGLLVVREKPQDRRVSKPQRPVQIVQATLLENAPRQKHKSAATAGV